MALITDLKVYVGQDEFNMDGFKFFIATKPNSVTQAMRYSAEPIIMTERKLHAPIQPTFELTDEQAQDLFNQLWNRGLRPKDGTGNSGHMAATEKHLQDMRLIAFNKLDIKI